MTQYIYNRWTEWESRQLEDPDLTREMQEIMAAPEHRDERIHDCCYKDLEFGTGGLREIMGIGTNRMNICTVSRASRGYAAYLKENFGGMQGVGEKTKGIRVVIASSRQPAEVPGFRPHIGRGILPRPDSRSTCFRNWHRPPCFPTQFVTWDAMAV
ncbi:MAG: hypothetical protein ACLRZZ_08155 [Enterocloster sp.]